MPVCVSAALRECICMRACRMCGNKGATWVFGWAESKTRLRCRCSQLLGREEGGLLCGIYRHSCFPLIHKDLRGGVRGTQATRAHMTTAVLHTLVARGARGLPSAVGRGHIRSQSASLRLVVLREVIHVRRRKANESQPSYQSISHRSHWEECSVLQKSRLHIFRAQTR